MLIEEKDRGKDPKSSTKNQKQTYDPGIYRLCRTGSCPGKFYGTTKIQKLKIKWQSRPITN